MPTISADDRARHQRWAIEITSLPTASGKEQNVAAWIRRWAAERPEVELSEDPAGNLEIRVGEPLRSRLWRGEPGSAVYFTAHLDHPAFVVERVVGPGTLALSFRGGVMADYFAGAGVAVYAGGAETPIKARLTGETESYTTAFKMYLAELQTRSTGVQPGDIATWDLPAAEVRDGLLHAPACDDLSAVAAALCAYDVLLAHWRATAGGEPAQDVRLLFTRAEEIGFVGAIAAVKHGTMPLGSRVISLENSRSFADSPIGGGPIVRVGDRMSIFDPRLTDACASRAEELAGGPSAPTATQKAAAPAWPWQRKLMAGGACESTVFCAAGYEATCLCVPLGNYHNMADLAAVQARTHTGPAKIEREFISIADYHGLVDLLVACGQKLGSGSTRVQQRLESIWGTTAFVLER